MKGIQAVNPYSETAGFPTGAQGRLSTTFGIKGRSHTHVSERLSGADAIIDGAEMIVGDHADIVIAGGTEAPLCALVWSAYQDAAFLVPTRNDLSVYQPFDQMHEGMLLGEGATFFVLEEYEHALRRGVPVVGELCGWSQKTDSSPQKDGHILARAITQSIAHAHMQREQIGGVFAQGSGLLREDSAELRAINLAFGEHARPFVTATKAAFGHLIGAATPTDLAILLHSLATSLVPALPQGEMPLPCDNLDVVRGRVRVVDDHLSRLLLSGGSGGLQACLVVRAHKR